MSVIALPHKSSLVEAGESFAQKFCRWSQLLLSNPLSVVKLRPYSRSQPPALNEMTQEIVEASGVLSCFPLVASDTSEVALWT
jgi:hypothetical protein